jgi:hypothetical protein
MNRSFVWVFNRPESDEITMLPLPPKHTKDYFDFLELADIFVPKYVTYFLRRLSKFKYFF